MTDNQILPAPDSAGSRWAGRVLALRIAALLILSFAVYLNALPNAFVGDDHDLIVNFPLIRDPANIPRFFLMEDTFLDGGKTGYYRPVARLSYMADYLIWGLNPFGYHLMNIILHACTVITLFFVARRIVPDVPAFIASVLFAAHPVHVEAVTWPAARNNILSLLFLLLSFFFYLRSVSAHDRKVLLPLYALSLISFGLSLLSKEFGVVFPVLLLTYHAIGESVPGPQNRWRAVAARSRLILPFIGVIIVFALVRNFVVGPPAAPPLTALARNATYAVKSLFTYVQIMLVPVNLKATYFIPEAEPFFNLRGIAASLGLPILIAALFLSYGKNKGLFFGLAWFFLFLVPVSGIITFSPFPVAERYVYVASPGFCLVAGLLAGRLLKWSRTAGVILLACLISFYAFQTIRRNLDWRDDLSLALSTTRQIPSSPVAWYYLGNAYRMKGQVAEAIAAFRKSLEISPGFPHALLGLAETYEAAGMIPEATDAYREVVQIMPDSRDARGRLALLYYRQEKISEAIAELKELLRHHPDAADARENLRNLEEEIRIRQTTADRPAGR